MTEQELERYVYSISNKFEKINRDYLTLMGKHVKEIGKLSPDDVYELEHMLKMGTNVNNIRNSILAECGKTSKELDVIINDMLKTTYKDNEYLFALKNKKFKDLKDNIDLQNHIEAIKRRTNGSMINIANTTVLDKTYRELIDTGIQAVSSGVEDYNTAMRKVISKAGAGARVTYASGVTRRLDSAVRMNLLEGNRQFYQNIRMMSGEIFGADGYEISAHFQCATDHLDIQGRQYSIKEFEELNDSLVRPIGELNCRHHVFPIVLGISKQTYSQEELDNIKHNTTEKIDIFGKQYTRYQCTQLLRQAETAMRYTRDTQTIARASGDDVLVEQMSRKLQNQETTYLEICQKANLRNELYRANSEYRFNPKPISNVTLKIRRRLDKNKHLNGMSKFSYSTTTDFSGNNLVLKRLEQIAENWNVDVKEARRIISDKVEHIVKSNSVAIKVPTETLDKILTDKKFKNMFESGKTLGSKNKPIRIKREKDILNVTETTPIKDKPIYGMTWHYSYESGGPIKYYGDVICVLDKNKIVNNSSFTLGDTFNNAESIVASELKTPTNNLPGYQLGSDWSKMSKEDFIEGDLSDLFKRDYIEVQIHGNENHGIDIIDHIVFKTQPGEELLDRVDELNIPYEIIK